MDFVRIVPLLLILLFSGQSHMVHTKQANNSCKNCPVGYRMAGKCNDSTTTDHCEKCREHTFLDKENQELECLRCRSCDPNAKEKQPCAFDRDTICECKEGYYYVDDICQSCSLAPDCSDNFLRKCCQSNISMKCKKKCKFPTAQTSTSTVKTTTATEVPENNSHSPIMIATSPTQSVSTEGKSSNNLANPTVDPALYQLWHVVVWLLLMVTVVTTLLVLRWLLLLITRKKCPYWSTSKDLETPAQDPKSNEQSSHQGSSPATLKLSFSEETPMMLFCQKPPALNSNSLPDSNCMDEQSNCWPAIVLYAIIKEVPLRRWKEFLRLLSVADQQMERVELEAGLGSIEKQYQMLRLWSQGPSASLNDVYSSLHYMNLSGCAQLLQESLEKLQWRPQAEQGFTT